MSVHWPIIRRCLARPGAVAIVDDYRTWRRIDILGAGLHLASEIERSTGAERIGSLLPTCGVFPAVALASWMLDRAVVPFNPLLAPDELQLTIDDSRVDTIFTVRPLLDRLDTLPSGVRLVCVDELALGGVPDLRMPGCPRSEDLAVLLYTSGTSGRPKGVRLTHGNLAANVGQCVRHAEFGTSDVLLGILPQFHSFGLTVLTLLPLTVGCRVVYTTRFVPKRIVDMLREHRPTAFVGIPSMFGALLTVKSAGPADFRSLRFAVAGGEPLSLDLAERFHDRFHLRINEGYGLTETAPVTNLCLPHEHRPGSVGRTLPDIEVRIADAETGATLPPGEEGEIRFRGPNVFAGYEGLPEETEAAFDADRFFRTGDMGRLDADGHLYVTGRIKEMLIIGGENVFPREIEEVVCAHPAVHASGVIGVQDDVRGELPLAFVELAEGATPPSDMELRAWCRERLAAYKVPREFRVVDELPRSPTGKVLRRRLREDEPAAVEHAAGAS